jgi:hypothetical protein
MISIAAVVAATCGQSEADTISAVAAHATKRGIAANGLTQGMLVLSVGCARGCDLADGGESNQRVNFIFCISCQYLGRLTR